MINLYFPMIDQMIKLCNSNVKL